jgi:hypothetical protein
MKSAIVETDAGTIWPAERSFWKFAAFFLGAVSFLRGVRRPSTWAATQALVNYDDGLVKRGLIGATLGKVFHAEKYTHFTLLSYAILCLLFVLLIALTYRSGVFEQLGSGLLPALYFGSYAFTYLTHLVGYSDIVMATLACVCLLPRNPRIRLLLCLPICILGMLVHESFLILFVPVILFGLFVDGSRDQTSDSLKKTRLAIGAVSCVSLAVAAGLSLSRPMSDQQASALYGRMTLRADFPVRTDFSHVMQTSLAENVRGMWQFAHTSNFRMTLLIGAMVFVPTLILLGFAMKSIASRFDSRLVSNRWMVALALCTGLAPLSMTILGWDLDRWDALACLDCYLASLVALRGMPKITIVLPPWFLYATVLAIALSMASGGPMMDHLRPNPYPFLTPSGHFLRDGVSSQGLQAPH